MPSKRYPLRNSSFRGRRTPQQIADEAARKAEARKIAEGQRITERDDLAMTLIAIAESMRKDENIDARRVHRVEIDLDDQLGAVVVIHSKVFPTQKHMVSPSRLSEVSQEVFGADEPEDPDPPPPEDTDGQS